MRLRVLVGVNAVLAVLWGALFVAWPGTMMPLYGLQESFETLALSRVFGAAFVGFGLLVWAVRDVVELPRGRSALGMLVAAHLFGLVIVAIQQGAIWGSLTGGFTVAFYFFFAGAYGWAFYKAGGRTAGGPGTGGVGA